jgi:uncharacterized protein (TIGR00730 family)
MADKRKKKDKRKDYSAKKSSNIKKAYADPEFLYSADARPIRILSEFLEPQSRFRHAKIKDTIVFFGSARLISGKAAKDELKKLEAKKITDRSLADALIDIEMSRYYDDAVELSCRLTKWSLGLENPHRRFVICSGGGPGIMEAANKGAKKAGGKSIGLNISLPFEQEPNEFISPDLNFEFHYFFMRKFWFAYLAKALVIMPGGFGTIDELFEILTLVQTGKIRKKMPILIYDKEFWGKILDFSEFAKKRLINEEDLELFHIADSVDDAFKYLTGELSKHYLKIEVSLFNVDKSKHKEE